MFSKNIHSFPTAVHEKLYKDGLRLTPLTVSLADTGGISGEFTEWQVLKKMVYQLTREMKLLLPLQNTRRCSRL